ncbi:hypothetical protein LTR53_011587 [Teratosphaeriaceae sp. CCFEE 6253]|nr:hypothetical protein LTR53_011587 [Teratosphaeriaceae sp. CCFEE 6253]
MVRKHANLAKDVELEDAAWAATRGAVVGAAKVCPRSVTPLSNLPTNSSTGQWGIFSAVAGGLGFALSPTYRALTFQFKVFLQMSGMTAGSMIEADRRLRVHEVQVRRQKVAARDAEVWRRYESDFVDKAADQRIQNSSK